MTSIEDQLVRDIAAVAGRIELTDSDLLEARAAVDRRARAQQQRQRNLSILGAAAAVVVAGALGFTTIRAAGAPGQIDNAPANPGPTVTSDHSRFLHGAAPTPDGINGFWREDNGTIMVRFQTDGTVQWSADGMVISNPVVTGTYVIDGDEIAITQSADSPSCESGPNVTLRASLPTAGRMNVVVPTQVFGTCIPASSTMVLEHVLPTSKRLSGVSGSGASGFAPLETRQRLFGDWMAEGGGYLMELSPEGDYYIADESTRIVDQGVWEFRGRNLTLASDGTTRCLSGDQLVLAGVQQYDPGTAVIRGNVVRNDCAGDWTPAAWILIPHQGSDK